MIEPAHYKHRRPCSKCESKERVRICSHCYGRLRDEVEHLRDKVAALESEIREMRLSALTREADALGLYS